MEVSPATVETAPPAYLSLSLSLLDIQLKKLFNGRPVPLKKREASHKSKPSKFKVTVTRTSKSQVKSHK